MNTREEARLAETLSASQHGGLTAPVVGMDRRPLIAPSSHRLEALDVTLEDGTVLPLVLKHLGRDGLLPNALTTRPSFLADSWREAVVYTELLSGGEPGPARCYGVFNEAGDGQSLVLERIAGADLSESSFAAWMTAAGWLGRFHTRMSAGSGARPRRLLRYDAPAWRRWMMRATDFAAPRDRDTVEWLVSRHSTAVDCLSAVPVTVLHGDFHASNVLVVDEPEDRRVCPVDWELAGIGPGLLDLAALTAGDWSPVQRHALVGAYLEAAGGLYAEVADLERALTASRFQMSIQWLGWSPDWRPPPEHRQDWLADAVRCAEALEQ